MVSKDQKRWRIFAHVVLIFFSVMAFLPFLLLIISSFTDETVALLNGYSYLPEKFALDAYEYIWKSRSTYFRAYGMTILVTAIGTTVSLILTSLTGYVLSKKNLPGVKIMNFVVIFTMLFNGGLVATYITYVGTLGIKANPILSLVVPSLLMNAFMVMLVRNYFATSIPEEIYESARIDGASEIRIFIKLVIPLSVPILATVGLMTGIAYWNDWQNSLYYVNDKKYFTIQAILNSINEGIAALKSLTPSGISTADLPSTTIRMAVAVVGILPILLLYPFFQKYFAKGLVAGAVKG